MTDKEIIAWLSSVCKFQHTMSGEVCKFISFYDDNDTFGGTIRRHPMKREIIEMVARMPNLTFLNLRKCKVGPIPELASRSLEWLDLSSNDLPVVPDWVTLQPRLGFLSVGANNLAEVPDLSGLTMLRTLKLHKNRLTVMPEIPKDVASLILFLNPLDGIPDVVQSLWNLETFSFGMTNAKKMPSFERLRRLKLFILTHTEIEEVPEEICSLPELTGLVLAKNRISRVPERIGDLTKLKNLSLYYNRITELPDSLFDLNLERFNVSKNQLTDRERVISTFSNIEFLKA